MIYKCKDCLGLLESNLHGMLECLKCKRSVPDPGYAEINLPQKAPSHSLLRKDMMAGDSYQAETPEFPYEAGQD